MKTTDKGLLHGIASSIGRMAGSVEGAIEGVANASQHEQLQHPHFEASDISGRGVLLAGAGVLVGIWIAIGILYFVLSYFSHERARLSPPPLPVMGTREALPPQPRLQQSPPRDLKAMREREDWELNHYHWIDKGHSELAIPIEQAMRLVAGRGIPPQKLAPNATLTPPQEGSRLTGFEGKVEPEPR